MTRRERNDDDVAASFANFGGTDDRLFSVIPALHQNIRPKQRDQLARRVLFEDDHGVHRLERGKHITAFRGAPNWPFRPFETPH